MANPNLLRATLDLINKNYNAMVSQKFENKNQHKYAANHHVISTRLKKPLQKMGKPVFDGLELITVDRL